MRTNHVRAVFCIPTRKAATMSFTTTEQKGLYPDLTFPYTDAVPDALIVNPAIATVAGIIEGDKPQIRVPYVKTDPTSGFTAEGSEIADGGGVLDEVLVTTGKIATIVTQSNESATFSTASQLIASGVSRSITTSANGAFLTNPAASTLGSTGLLNTTGMLTPDAAALADIIDLIADTRAQIETNGGTPTAILVSPLVEAALRKLKDATGGTYILGNPSQNNALSIFALPVIANKSITANTLLIDSAAEVVAAVGNINVASSTDAAFTSDSIVRRATWRIGHNVIHPDRLAKLTITAA
ncbi:MAG: phage major capsid protein [Bifidobacterium aquikefiri]